MLLCACGQAPEPVNDAPEKLGISSGNYLNRGYLAQNENDPYYYCLKYIKEGDRSQNGVYRVNSKTGESIRLTDQIGYYLNLYDDYLYYQTKGYSYWPGAVWRVKCDGSSPAELYLKSSASILGVMIANDEMYLQTSDGLFVAHMSDAGNLTDSDLVFVDANSGNPVVLNDTLYYKSTPRGEVSYRSKPLDNLTSTYTEIVNLLELGHSVTGYGYVFYQDTNYTNIYRASLTDGEIEEVVPLKGFYVPMNLYKGHIYYMYDGYVWRCDLNGDNLEKIQEKKWKEGLSEADSQSFQWYFYIANDTVYIYNNDQGKIVCQIKLEEEKGR